MRPSPPPAPRARDAPTPSPASASRAPRLYRVRALSCREDWPWIGGGSRVTGVEAGGSFAGLPVLAIQKSAERPVHKRVRRRIQTGSGCRGRPRARPMRLASSDSKRARSASNAGALLGSRSGRFGSCRIVATPGSIARIRERNAWLAVRRAPVLRRSSSTSALNAASASGESTNSRLTHAASASGRAGRVVRASGSLVAPDSRGPSPAAGPITLLTLAASRSRASDEDGRGVSSDLAMTLPTRRASSRCSHRASSLPPGASPRGTRLGW